MLSGFYSIASGLLAQQRNLDVIGNNLVNAQTPGFRTDRMVFTTFEHELMMRREASHRAAIGTGSPITLVDDVITLHHSGLFEETGFAFDLAIDGPGFFTVEGPGGQVYLTRGGQFNMDAEGYLILADVGRVLGRDGNPVRVRNALFTVTEDGTVNSEAGRRIGNIAAVSPPTVEDLVSMDNGLYQLQDGAEAAPAAGFRMMQGVLERSNVDYNREMTTFIETQRAFQACSTALQMIDGLNRRSVAQIASI